MSAELLALLERDLSGGIFAAADLAQMEAEAEAVLRADDPYWSSDERTRFERRWTPDQALAAIRRWRGVVERHVRASGPVRSDGRPECDDHCMSVPWPCPDLTETADEARAYLGGAA